MTVALSDLETQMLDALLSAVPHLADRIAATKSSPAFPDIARDFDRVAAARFTPLHHRRSRPF